MPTEFSGLVDADSGLISRRIFIEPEIYEQELKQIFTRCWLFLCHDSQVARPGDFLTTHLCEDPLLVVATARAPAASTMAAEAAS